MKTSKCYAHDHLGDERTPLFSKNRDVWRFYDIRAVFIVDLLDLAFWSSSSSILKIE